MALTHLDGDAVRQWTATATAALATAAPRIDALNVFPVPDGDTGTNMHLTLRGALDAVADLAGDAPLHEVADAAARGALLGARGNSGVITAAMLRGWAVELAGLERAGHREVRRALTTADEQARQAVADPVEGTVLTVLRAAARAARKGRGRLPDVVHAAAEAARKALARTPSQLAMLRDAGVVDAGGAGAVVLLDALARVVDGEDVADPGEAAGEALAVPAPEPPPAGPDAGTTAADGPQAGSPTVGCRGPGPLGPAFEVTYLLDCDDGSVAGLRTELAGVGESVVVTGGDGLWSVHVHSDDAGAALEAGVRAGRPHRIAVAHLHSQVAHSGVAQQGAASGARVGVVAWAAGPGLAEVFAAAGVVPVRTGPHRAATGDVLAAVRAAGAPAVVVLPNDRDTLAVAESAAQVARAEGRRVVVVPTRAQVQGLAAAAVHDAARDLDDDLARMSAAAGATRHGGVTVAVRDGITMAGACRTGDVLGVVDGDFAVIGQTLAEVARDVVGRLLSGGGELLTLVLGADAPAGLADAVAAPLRRQRPDVEVVVLDGGQPRYPLLVGVE